MQEENEVYYYYYFIYFLDLYAGHLHQYSVINIRPNNLEYA